MRYHLDLNWTEQIPHSKQQPQTKMKFCTDSFFSTSMWKSKVYLQAVLIFITLIYVPESVVAQQNLWQTPEVTKKFYSKFFYKSTCVYWLCIHRRTVLASDTFPAYLPATQSLAFGGPLQQFEDENVNTFRSSRSIWWKLLNTMLLGPLKLLLPNRKLTYMSKIYSETPDERLPLF